jgi:hypothetical protein
MSPRDSGAHWRALAKEVLAIAAKIEDPECKPELTAIADKYEALAERADVHAVGHPLSRRG